MLFRDACMRGVTILVTALSCCLVWLKDDAKGDAKGDEVHEPLNEYRFLNAPRGEDFLCKRTLGKNAVNTSTYYVS